MPSQEILALARQGNTDVLKSILKHVFNPQGTKLRLLPREQYLHVLLESDTAPPNPDEAVALVQNLFKTLKIESFDGVKLYGHQTGNPDVTWKREIFLKSAAPSEALHSTDSTVVPAAAPMAIATGESVSIQDDFLSRESFNESSDSSEDSLSIEFAELEPAGLDASTAMGLPDLEPSSVASTEPPSAAVEAAEIDPPAIEWAERDTSELEVAEPETSQLDLPTVAATGAVEAEITDTAHIASDLAEDLAEVDAVETEVDAVEAAELDLISQPVLPPVPAPAARLPQSEEPEPSGAVNQFMNRPEAIVVILFVGLLLIWQFYIDLVEDDGSSISGVKLAKRLGVSPSTISRRKHQPDFSVWSRSLDPEGIAWLYADGVFLPLFGEV